MRCLASIAAIAFAVFGVSTVRAAEKKSRFRGLVQGYDQLVCDSDAGCLWGKLGSIYIDSLWVSHPNVYWRCQQPWMVALTFEDGPVLETSNVLDALKEAGDVIATFFVSGDQITETTGPILTRAENEGHVVAHNSYDLVSTLSYTGIVNKVERDAAGNLTPKSLAFFARQIEDTVAVASPHLPWKGLRPYMRPPWLALDTNAATYLKDKYDIYVVQANLETNDNVFGATNATITNAFTGNLYDDASDHSWVVRQRDGFPATTQAIPAMIEYATGLGYAFVGMDECLGYPDETRLYISTKTPTITRVYPPTPCNGIPCDEPTHCRSKQGWCGITDYFCLDNPTWVPGCVFIPPSKSPSTSPTTSQPTFQPSAAPSAQPSTSPTIKPTEPTPPTTIVAASAFAVAALASLGLIVHRKTNRYNNELEKKLTAPSVVHRFQSRTM